MTASGNTLRWRVKQSGNTVAPVTHTTKKVAQTAAAEPINARGSFAERARQAARVQNTNAFEDPFGDRKGAVRQAQAIEPIEDAEEGFKPMGLQPPRQAPPAFQPRPGFAPQPEVEPQPEVQPQPDVEPAPEPMMEDEAPAPRPMFRPMLRPAPPANNQIEPLPQRDQDPEWDVSPKFPKYNDRNCEVDGRVCEEHRTKMKSDLLIHKDDLLDITPPLSLSTDTEEQRANAEKNFNRIPVREWRNRAGVVVATGRLREVAYRYAIIQDESGRTVKVKLNELGDDEHCFLAGWWNVPSECVLGDEVYAGRDFIPSTMTWTASALCHKPLYFEEVQLERYGHTAGIFQPALSGAHFFINIAVLPYKMGINPPHECQYTLGYYRPGSCAPWMIPPVPLSVRGAATQAAAVGIVAPLIP